MKFESAPSVYDTFWPQSQERVLVQSKWPRVQFVARLSAISGVIMLVLFLAELVTLPLIGPLISYHIVFGVILAMLLVVKLSAVGYRFARFYAGDSEFVQAGPPWLPLRYIAPGLVLSTIALLGSGVEMTFAGPGSFSTLFLEPAHVLVSVGWLFFVMLHVFVYFRRSIIATGEEIRYSSQGCRSKSQRIGARLRMTIVLVSILLGTALTLPLRSQIGSWERAMVNTPRPTKPKAQVSRPFTPIVLAQYRLLEARRIRVHLHSVEVMRSRS